MKIKEVVKTEEVIEREISLPFYYISRNWVGTMFLKIADEETCVYVRTPDELDGKVTGIDVATPYVALSQWPVTEESTREAFEEAYWKASLYLKQKAVPEYVLSEEEKQDFQHQY